MAKETIRQKTHNSVDKIIDKAESMRDTSKGAMARLKEKAIATRDNVDKYIQNNPKKSVVIAAGVGAAVGAGVASVIARRRHQA